MDKGEQLMRETLESKLAKLRQWHELNAKELEGEEGEEDNRQFHLESAEAIKEALNSIR